MVTWEEKNSLPAEKKEVFENAYAKLKEAVPPEYICGYFAYHIIDEACDSCDTALILNGNNAEISIDVCEKYMITSEIKTTDEIVARQYVDNEWIRKEVNIVDNAIIVREVVDAPVALFIRNAGGENEKPVSIDSPTAVGYLKHSNEGCDCRMVLWGQRESLPSAKETIYEAAKECLLEAVPEGFACRDFVYHEVRNTCSVCNLRLIEEKNASDSAKYENNEWLHMSEESMCATYGVDYLFGNMSEVIVKQFMNNEWTQIDAEMNNNQIVIKSAADGPMAICIK